MALRKNQHDYAKARDLRRQMTLPEVLLWRELRRHPLKFRKQHPVGPYVIDFYCAAAKLGIEIDGMAHDTGDRAERDLRRAEFLGGRGITLARFTAREVLADAGAVADMIVQLSLARRK